MPLVAYWLLVAAWGVVALHAAIFLAAFWPAACRILLEDRAVEDAECPICLDDLRAGDMVARLRCGHACHPRCAEGWLHAQGSCPTCRAALGGMWLL